MPVGSAFIKPSNVKRESFPKDNSQSVSATTGDKQVFSLIGQQNGGSLSLSTNPSKTVLLVKCTDTSLNAFNEAVVALKVLF